jgi:hypothetical protein
LEIKLDPQINVSKHLIELKIINETDSKYVIPINMMDLKPYFQAENCMNYDDVSFNDANDLSLRLAFLNNSDGSYENKIFNNPNPSTLIHSDEKSKKEFEKKMDSAAKAHTLSVDQWIKKYDIKKNKKWAEINQTIFPNLLYLNPQQVITYKIYIDPLKLYSSKMHITGSYFYSYHLENNVDYNFLLKYCVDSKIYEYLTKEQKKKLKGYTLFSGSLQSNVLSWK